MFGKNYMLQVISWIACGVTSLAKFIALQAYVYRYHPQVVFIQEALVGGTRIRGNAPMLTGYVSFTHW